MAYSILIVEDDTDINNLLSKILLEAGYLTRQAFSGTEAQLLLEREQPDLILLDLMLPGMTGEQVLQSLRQQGNQVPVLVISAKNSVQDKVSLLKLGADDYISKPFDLEEVIARVEVSLRRVGKSQQTQSSLSYKKLSAHAQSRQIFLEKILVPLTAYEYDLLYLLMKEPEKVYSRESLYEAVWQDGYYGENNTVNVHISNIRKKLKEIDPQVDYIQTVYGIGFKLQ